MVLGGILQGRVLDLGGTPLGRLWRSQEEEDLLVTCWNLIEQSSEDPNIGFNSLCAQLESHNHLGQVSPLLHSIPTLWDLCIAYGPCSGTLCVFIASLGKGTAL